MTVNTLIRDLGGTSVVAEALGIESPSVVSNWRSRGKIPGKWWSKLAELAATRGVNGVTVETLGAMHAASLAAEAQP